MGTGSFSKQIIDQSSRYYDYNSINDGYDKILKNYSNNTNIASLHAIIRGIPIIYGIKNITSIILSYKYNHRLDSKWTFNKYHDESNTSYYVSRDDFTSILRMSFICNHIFDIVPEIVNQITDLLDSGKPLLISKESWLDKISKVHNYDFDKVSNIQGYNNLVKYDELCNYLANTLLPSVDKNDSNLSLQFKAVVQGIVDSSINDALFNLLSKQDSNLHNIKGLLKHLKIQDLEMINKHIDSEVLSARKIEKLISQSAPNSYRK